MTSLTPATTRRRTGIEMQDLAAATRMILAGIRNRCLLWLLARFLPVIALTFGNIATAHADGVGGTLINGRTVSGAVSATGADVYTFKVPVSGGSVVLGLSETGSHNDAFVPEIAVTDPHGHLSVRGSQLFTILRLSNAAEGTWSVKVSAHRGGTTGGGYALTVVDLPSAQAAVNNTLSTGQSRGGTNSRGQLDIWSFSGAAGHTKTLTLGHTAGKGFQPEIMVFSPTGAPVSMISCAKSCSQDIGMRADGTYTVLAYRNDRGDVPGSYSLSVADKN